MLESCFCSLVTLFINLQCENHLSNFSSLIFLAWQKFSFGQLLYFPEKQQGKCFHLMYRPPVGTSQNWSCLDFIKCSIWTALTWNLSIVTC